MPNLGTRTYSVPVNAPSRIVVTVSAPNGKGQDTQSITVG